MSEEEGGLGSNAGGGSGPARRGYEGHRRGSLRSAWSAVRSPSLPSASAWLLRYPRLLAVAAGASLILALASATGPLFLSTAENGLLARTAATFCPSDVGFRVSTSGPLGGAFHSLSGERIAAADLFHGRDRSIRADTAGIPNLGPPTLTIAKQAGSYELGPVGIGGVTAPVRVLSREGALSHIDVVASTGGQGVWLPDTIAATLGAKPGDPLTLTNESRSVGVRVAGVYRDLAHQPETPFWCSLSHILLPPSAFATYIPPPFVLMDRPTLLDVGARLRDTDVQFIWEFPTQIRDLTLPEAGALAAAFTRLGERLQNRSSTFGQSLNSGAETELPAIVASVSGTIGTLRGPVQALSLAARLVALLLFGLVGLYWVDRRAIEAGLLSARGVPPAGVAARALAECLLPVLLAAAVGWALAIGVLRAFGPGAYSAGSATAAALQVLATTAAGLVVLAAAAFATARAREERSASASASSFGSRSLVARAPWEIAVLALAGLSLSEILSSAGRIPAPGQAPRLDPLVLLFPILVVAGGAGLAARAIRRLARRLRSSSPRSTAAFLASRRLARAAGTAPAVFVGVAVAVGVLAYASILTSSVQATSSAKALVFAGGDVSYTLTEPIPVPRALTSSATAVQKFDTTVVHVTGLDSAEMIAVDRSTFARGAYWDGSFSGASLQELLRGLAPGPKGSPAPVLIAGGTLPPTGEINLEAPIPVTIRFRSAESASAFPGMTANVPLIVIDRSLLLPDAAHLNQLWVRGDPAAIEPVVSAAIAARADPPLVLAESVAAKVEATNDFLPLFWMLRFLQWLGLATGLVALWGVLLHLESQQRTRQVSYAIARRMGLTPSANRTALQLELGAMLAAATAVGMAVAWIAARLVAGTLDLKPELPPSALFRLPWLSLGLTAAAIAIVCWIVVRVVQRGTERTDVGRVMRSAA